MSYRRVSLLLFSVLALGIYFFSCSTDISLPPQEQTLVESNDTKPAPQSETEDKSSVQGGSSQDTAEQSSTPKTNEINFPYWYSEADKRVHNQTFEDAIKNSKVFLANKDPSTWYYYNRIKNDNERPYRRVAYEIVMKMICNGAFLSGEDYPSYHSVGDSVPISEFPNESLWSAIGEIWDAIRWDHPEFFYISLYPFGCGVNDGNTVYAEFYKMGEYSFEDLQQDEQRALQSAQELLVNFDYTLSPDEQLKSIFDITCKNISYFYNHNSDRLQVYTAWGGLVVKHTCCLGYALAYQYLAYLANVDAVVFTVSGLSGQHAWNYIQTSQGFQPVDNTAGSVYDNAGWLKESGGLSKISREYHPTDEIVQQLF